MWSAYSHSRYSQRLYSYSCSRWYFDSPLASSRCSNCDCCCCRWSYWRLRIPESPALFPKIPGRRQFPGSTATRYASAVAPWASATRPAAGLAAGSVTVSRRDKRSSAVATFHAIADIVRLRSDRRTTERWCSPAANHHRDKSSERRHHKCDCIAGSASWLGASLVTRNGNIDTERIPSRTVRLRRQVYTRR